jgi:hypothetical protein
MYKLFTSGDVFFIERYKGVKQRYEAVFFDFSFLIL